MKKLVWIFRQILKHFSFLGKTGYSGRTSNGMVHCTRNFKQRIAISSASMVLVCRKELYSDLPINPVKKREKRNTSEGIPFAFGKIPVERIVLFDFLPERSVLPYPNTPVPEIPRTETTSRDLPCTTYSCKLPWRILVPKFRTSSSRRDSSEDNWQSICNGLRSDLHFST